MNAATPTPLADLTGDYTLDPAHSEIGFVARHAMVTKVRGTFNDVTGSGHFDGEHPENSSARLVIKAESIDTRNEQRDAHLRTNDFLDIPNFPEITFESTAVERLGEVTFRLVGDLTVRGVTRPVAVDLEYQGVAKDPYGNLRVGFEGAATISRKDFGVTWNATLETGGVLVGDKIDLVFEISAIKVA